MAVSDDIKKQHEKIRKKGFKASVAYFWDYYRIPVAIIIVVALFAGFFAHDLLSNKPYGFYAIMFNVSQQPDAEALDADFSKYGDIDTSKYTCYIDTTTTLNTENYTQYDVSTQEKLSAITAAAELDCIVADPSVFALMSRSDYFYDLRDILSDEQLAKYADNIYYVDYAVIEAIDAGTYDSSEEASDAASEATTDDDYISEEEVSQVLGLTTGSSVIAADDFVMPDPSTMKDPIPVGIVVTDSPYMKKNGTYAGTVAIYGVIGNTERLDLAISFLDYLYEE